MCVPVIKYEVLMGLSVRKALKVVWVVFSAAWSLLCIMAAFLGAGMSVANANIEPTFLLYWLGPIGVPSAIYLLFFKFNKSQGKEKECG